MHRTGGCQCRINFIKNIKGFADACKFIAVSTEFILYNPTILELTKLLKRLIGH